MEPGLILLINRLGKDGEKAWTFSPEGRPGRQAFAHHPCRPVVCGALRPSVDLSPVLRDARTLLASAASRPGCSTVGDSGPVVFLFHDRPLLPPVDLSVLP